MCQYGPSPKQHHVPPCTFSLLAPCVSHGAATPAPELPEQPSSPAAAAALVGPQLLLPHAAASTAVARPTQPGAVHHTSLLQRHAAAACCRRAAAVLPPCCCCAAALHLRPSSHTTAPLMCRLDLPEALLALGLAGGLCARHRGGCGLQQGRGWGAGSRLAATTRRGCPAHAAPVEGMLASYRGRCSQQDCKSRSGDLHQPAQCDYFSMPCWSFNAGTACIKPQWQVLSQCG
jgi:hypothetical protein